MQKIFKILKGLNTFKYHCMCCTMVLEKLDFDPYKTRYLKKKVLALGAWFKRVVLFLLTNQECVWV